MEFILNYPPEAVWHLRTVERGWELRCGPNNRFRVFDDAEAANQTVAILGVGIKVRDRVVIPGGETAPGRSFALPKPKRG